MSKKKCYKVLSVQKPALHLPRLLREKDTIEILIMKKELLIKYGNDIGKYLIDISKLLFGSVFIAPILKEDTIWSVPAVGIISSILTLTLGLVLSNLKIK